MKVVGIITEYNPFHTGHLYQLQEAKRQTGADYTVIVMSPDFVQRGEPALFDKYFRTRCALLCGADLVLELPVAFAASGAEAFASYAVLLLSSLGLVDTLSFGAETADAAVFRAAGQVLSKEPDAFRTHLKALLSQGLPFAAAREQALLLYLEENDSNNPLLFALHKNGFLHKSNNILGTEYCKALETLCIPMDILPICREGASYRDRSLTGPYASAAAIRSSICAQEDTWQAYLPSSILPAVTAQLPFAVTAEDFALLLARKLLEQDSFSHIAEISGNLSDRIAARRFACQGLSFAAMEELLLTRGDTRSHIRRALLHILLGVTKEHVRSISRLHPLPYARVLGFRRDAAPLLHAIKKGSNTLLLTKYSAFHTLPDGPAKDLLALDYSASHLYRSVLSYKTQTPFRTEYEYSPVRI